MDSFTRNCRNCQKQLKTELELEGNLCQSCMNKVDNSRAFKPSINLEPLIETSN